MTHSTHKHPCPDCHQCQWCSDDRCRLCRKQGCQSKLSIAEQIKLYEALNCNNDRQKPCLPKKSP